MVLRGTPHLFLLAFKYVSAFFWFQCNNSRHVGLRVTKVILRFWSKLLITWGQYTDPGPLWGLPGAMKQQVEIWSKCITFVGNLPAHQNMPLCCYVGTWQRNKAELGQRSKGSPWCGRMSHPHALLTALVTPVLSNDATLRRHFGSLINIRRAEVSSTEAEHWTDRCAICQPQQEGSSPT